MAETPCIAHSIRVLTCSGSCFSATETIAFLTHTLRIVGEVNVAAVCNQFEVSRLSFQLCGLDYSISITSNLFWLSLAQSLRNLWLCIVVRFGIENRIMLDLTNWLFAHSLSIPLFHSSKNIDLIYLKIEAGHQLVVLLYRAFYFWIVYGLVVCDVPQWGLYHIWVILANKVIHFLIFYFKSNCLWSRGFGVLGFWG